MTFLVCFILAHYLSNFFLDGTQCNNQGKQLLLLQEAKEDAEMDAEIALEMAMERQRKLSTTSHNSSAAGTYVGPCPNSPGEVGRRTLSGGRSIPTL